MIENFTHFWSRLPALYLGVVVLFATLIALTHSPWIVLAIVPFIAMTYPKILQTIVLGVGTWLYVSHAHPTFHFESIKGMAKVRVHEIQHVPTHYGKKERAQVTIEHFQSDGVELFNQKAFLYGKKIKSDHLLVEGRLTQWSPHNYILRATKVVEQSGNLARKRREIKDHLYYRLRGQMEKGSADLIYALLSGEVVNLNLRMLFSRLGISHLLAISGFHFSIIIALFSLLMKRANRRLTLATLFVLATSYFLFVGGFASIKRAYIMLLVLLVGQFFEYNAEPLNTLGACLLILLIWDPPIVLNLGFQLSFLATLSILLFYNPVNEMLSKVILRRSLFEAKQLNKVELVAYIFLSLFRKVFAVNVSVSVLCVPIVIYYFGVFPLYSLYYNLFIPPLIGLLLVGAIFSLLLKPLLIPLGALTKWLLTYLEYFPVAFDYRIEGSLPIEWLTMIVVSSITLGIWKKSAQYQNRREQKSLLIGSPTESVLS